VVITNFSKVHSYHCSLPVLLSHARPLKPILPWVLIWHRSLKKFVAPPPVMSPYFRVRVSNRSQKLVILKTLLPEVLRRHCSQLHLPPRCPPTFLQLRQCHLNLIPSQRIGKSHLVSKRCRCHRQAALVTFLRKRGLSMLRCPTNTRDQSRPPSLAI
jgi:hypothetical protein